MRSPAGLRYQVICFWRVAVECFGTEHQSLDFIEAYVHDSYDLTPQGIIKRLGLLDVDYNKVSAYGHFGKAGFPVGGLTYAVQTKDTVPSPPAVRSWSNPPHFFTVRSTCLSTQKPPARQRSVDTTDGGRKPESRIWKPIRCVCSAKKGKYVWQRWWITSFRTVVTRNFSGTRTTGSRCARAATIRRR